MIRRGTALVWIGILALSGMFLLGQDTWPPREREACCMDDGSCVFVYPDTCDNLGGTLQGPGTDCSTASCPQPQLVFITAGTYDGNLGGLAGADAICQAEADAEGLPGRYKAWLSDTTTDAIDRLLTSGGAYLKVDGVKVADDMADIIDCSNPECLQSPINVTPDGTVYNPDPPTEFVFTATRALGRYQNTAIGGNACDNWTSSTAGGGATSGMATAWTTGGWPTAPIDGAWTNMGALVSACDAQNRLYCFQQLPECTVPGDCNDANPCTDEDCVDNVCVFTNNTDPCDDLDDCTVGDTCSGGVCSSGDPWDDDGDTYLNEGCGGDDCDDSNADVYPDAPELCDGVDNQCPGDDGYGEVDEGCGLTVFITAGTHNGNFGSTGILGADDFCQTEANTAELPGTYKAWLSTTGTNAKDRFIASAGPYLKVNGVKVADDMTDIINCSNPSCLQSPINVTAAGVQLADSVMATQWTATNANGNRAGNTCGDWKTTAGSVYFGLVYGVMGDIIDYGWTNYYGIAVTACTEQNRLYCFEVEE